ncbi:MAG: hypothetical protein HYY40_10150 [Bacteroidetes bacterium]|nr:hypothetical protein [Bacteroidota bacterium]
MKNKAYLFIIALIISSCNGGGSGDEQATDSTAAVQTVQPPEGFMPLDLSQYGFPITIFVPQSDTLQGVPEPSVEETGGGAITVKSGKYFQLKIADGSGDLAARKNEFAVDDVYKYEYVIDEPATLLYKRQIASTPMEPEFHFIYVLKTGNRTIEVENVKDGVDEFPQRAAERMLDVIKATSVKSS